jgi:hypothetical protein
MSQPRRSLHTLVSVMLIFLACIAHAAAQQTTFDLAASSPASIMEDDLLKTEPPVMKLQPDAILNKFELAETGFREKMQQYAFRRDVVLQTIGPAGEVTGEYIRNSQFVLDDRGARVERILFHPKPTIREMTITKEDIQDLAGAQLFGFEMTDLSRYNLAYIGEETINSRRTYVIDVNPKEQPDPHQMRERYFAGRVWIDAQSFQIVKMHGVALPQGKQRFPTFETLREQFDASDLLLPSSTFADEVLHFPGRDVHYRIRVRYYDYKRFASKVSITEIDQPTQ